LGHPVDKIRPWIGLDWIGSSHDCRETLLIGMGGMTVTPLLISNNCSTVDAVSFKQCFMNF